MNNVENQNIKIVYNWIGPRGPIPNTELPNVLQFAAVSNSATTHTNNFWCDSIWHLIFCNKEGYTIGGTHYLGEFDVFVYPIQITWRISFENYFTFGGGILEYSDTPEHIKHLIRIRNGFILIEDSAEAHVTKNQLKTMHDYFQQHNIPMNKVIYVNGCSNAVELYEKFCKENGFTRSDQKMNMVSFPISADSLSQYFDHHNPQVPEYDVERIPEKLFLSWNRRFKNHRTAIALGLDKFGLVDRSYMSMGLLHPENSFVEFPKTLNEFNYYFVLDLSITDDDIINFRKKLPLVLDGETDIVKMCQDFEDKNRHYYQNSLVSIITETNFDDVEVTLTEKSFKPSKEKHPFIIVGATGTLKAIRAMGYKTFNDFWDESYDLIEDPRQRITKIIQVCREIASWDNNKIIDFRRKVKPILDHNYEQLKIRPSVMTAQAVRNIVFTIINKN